MSKGGTAVERLGIDNFQVLEDGVLQDIAFIEGPAELASGESRRRDIPKEVLFLIDVSVSVSKWRLLDDTTTRNGILYALTEDF